MAPHRPGLFPYGILTSFTFFLSFSFVFLFSLVIPYFNFFFVLFFFN